MPVAVESARKRIERAYFHHHGHSANNVLCGSLPRLGDRDTNWFDYGPYNNTGTITGAVWTPLARGSGMWYQQFNGTTDVVTVPLADSINNIWDGGGTLVYWINPDSDGEADAGRLFDKSTWFLNTTAEAAGALAHALTHTFTGNDGVWQPTSKIVTINEWQFCAWTYDSGATGNNPIFYRNGVTYTVGSGLTETVTPTGARDADAATNLSIGNNAVTTRSYDGGLALVRMYDAILTAEQIAGMFSNERHLFGV